MKGTKTKPPWTNWTYKEEHEPEHMYLLQVQYEHFLVL